MDEKTTITLEFPKVLERLAGYASFSASAELARNLHPVKTLEEALRLQKITTEARLLLSLNPDLTVGGATDIRPLAERAARHGMLEPSELLAVKDTLISARTLARTFERSATQYPHLAEIASGFPPPPGVIDAISRAISERGEILDQASEKLARIRHDVRVAHERLMARLQKMVTDPKITPMLQEALVTQRNGRYVIPLRSEFKSQVRSIVHDQSSSGATLFVEPLAIVDLNNEWHELQLAERDEERRILAELTDLVGANIEIIRRLVDALAHFDFALACARYAEDLRASEPLLVPYRPTTREHPGSTIQLIQARHPLLDPASVVPIDLELDEHTFCVVITGPNTGGKTVTLKTVGLLVLMAQSGLHIPARSGSALSVFENVFADIGDEQSIEQSLSTFSAHITNIVRILKQADERSLVILDELGAGTDPQEGSALARAILSYLLERRVTTFVATHYPELKTFAHSTPGVVNASLEFDVQTLRPTYQLVIGLPGRSNALAIAERLGLPPAILEMARAEIAPESLRADRLIADIARQRKQAVKERLKAERLRAEARRLERELADRLENIEEERRKVLAQARAEIELELEVLKIRLAAIRAALKQAHRPLEEIMEVERQIQEAEATLEEQARQAEKSAIRSPRPLAVGERVRIKRLGVGGTILTLDGEEVEVQAGALRVRVRQDELETLESESEPVAGMTLPALSEGKPPQAVLPPSPGLELHLRGLRVEDALDRLDTYLDKAYLAGLPFVRIVHGKGSGKLRQAVRQALQTHPHVLACEEGRAEEGGEGVTVVRLRE